MKTPDPYAPCPMCGEPQRLRREGDVWRPVQHTRRYTAASLYRRRCEGGTLPHDAVLAAVRDQRAEKKACVARAEYERTKARAEYERAVKDIDRRAADNLAATVALDRLLAKLDAERPAPPPPKPEPPPREVAPCPIVFLDVDGVLVTDASFRARWSLTRPPTIDEVEAHGATWLDAACVARLNALCADTGAELVAVSSWRRMGLGALRLLLVAGGVTAPVRDVVGWRFHDDYRAAFTRDWLDAHDCARWVVIDDEPARHWSRWDAGRIVAPHDGLTDDDAAAARAALMGETQ